MSSIQNRREWLRLLSKTPIAELKSSWKGANPGTDFQTLRSAEVGLAMIQGRADGTGRPFNLGEATITRCVVRCSDSANDAPLLGVGYTLGRDKLRAQLIAQFDALFQDSALVRAFRKAFFRNLPSAANRSKAQLRKRPLRHALSSSQWYGENSRCQRPSPLSRDLKNLFNRRKRCSAHSWMPWHNRQGLWIFQRGMSFRRHRARVRERPALSSGSVDPDVDCTPTGCDFGDNVFPISYRVRLHVDTRRCRFCVNQRSRQRSHIAICHWNAGISGSVDNRIGSS